MHASIKEDSQRTTTLTDNKKRDYENEGSSMVFQVTSHIVGFRSVLRVVNFNCCRCTHLFNFDLYANSRKRFTLRKRSFEVLSLHLPSVAVDRRKL